MKDRTSAILLSFFLGAFGAHRFYLKQITLGVLYLIFCWTFIPAFIAFIDFICFIVMSDDAFNKKYNTGMSQAAPLSSAADEIAKLHKLMRDGAITQEEFNKKKAMYF